MRLVNSYLQIFILLIFAISIQKCQSPNNPIVNHNKWENITLNLNGEKLKDIKSHNNDLFLSTLQKIYRLENNNWIEYANLSPDYIADFEFKEDTLYVLTMSSKLFCKDNRDSLVIKYSLDRSSLPAYDLCILQDKFYVGGFSQSPYYSDLTYYGLAKIESDSIYSYPMYNYKTAYAVDKIIQHKNTIFIGSFVTSEYFVAKLENETLMPIGLNVNGYSIGESYSMLSFGEKLLVGSGGEILSYENNYWTTYKKKLPLISNTTLEDKAISLLNKDDSILVGTMYGGILYYDDNLDEWTNYFIEGLPENYAINEMLLIGDVIYILVGKFYNFDATVSSQIYKIKR